MKGRQAYGTCGYCGRLLCLRKDGTPRRHRPEIKPGRQPYCKGSLLTHAAANVLRNRDIKPANVGEGFC